MQKIILLNYQNNYVGHSSMMNTTAKSFDILTISLTIFLHNYFYDLPKFLVQQNYSFCVN